MNEIQSECRWIASPLSRPIVVELSAIKQSFPSFLCFSKMAFGQRIKGRLLVCRSCTVDATLGRYAGTMGILSVGYGIHPVYRIPPLSRGKMFPLGKKKFFWRVLLKECHKSNPTSIFIPSQTSRRFFCCSTQTGVVGVGVGGDERLGIAPFVGQPVWVDPGF